MLKDLNPLRRNPSRIPPSEGPENLDPLANPAPLLDSDPSRPPLNTIQEPSTNPRPPRTPSKNRTQFRTPEKPATTFKNRFGWAPRTEPGSNHSESSDLLPLVRGPSLVTPLAHRPAARKASSVQSDCSSTQSTPTKSVTKPAFSRPPPGVMPRSASFMVASRGLPMSSPVPQVFAATEVPHFELREDPSFWMDHNVQVVIRVRPLNSAERSLQGYNRCLKQDSAQSITWVGQPEGRFTFDYVACETIDQDMLFRVAGLPMVENCMSGYNSCMFAYGQTGSGKTYTMLGEIGELEFRPSPERGMTPRIFEFLFARIRAEEESRRDEKLEYNCKCSFLEIYNEQIADLLDPSSTNLLLREDSRKGVYVDNLSEFEVETVNDILKLLFQGAANRRVATTNMNRESSRSHSVFTCVIESKWEKDSTTNLRFARLNLVDLAGSERQKTSGAEGDRLKEAANINKSLSTLGHVIMVLADLANGKQRHVPYRDSRLTFLLQDSLGGNSKTTIIANVSPSICSSNETLSTLKFAQRARLVQNNAVVNEDTSGDVIALQHQIRLLKEELFLIKRHNVSRSLSFFPLMEDSKEGECDSVDELHGDETSHSLRVSTKQLKSLEALLTGALRREKMAETTTKQLEAEIEQLNRLVRQREEDTHCSKMMLKFREDKIHRMEALLDGQLPSDSYLLEDNNTLKEEIEVLRARVDRNPEVTRFALENIRLLDQLRKFQDFYEEGERELLLNEVSQLRHQLMHVFDGNSEGHSPNPDTKSQEAEDYLLADSKDNQLLHMDLMKTSQELEDCRSKLNSCLEINASLTREISNLHSELSTIKPASHEDMELCLDSPESGHLLHSMHHAEEILNLQLELDILKTILGEEKTSRIEVEKKAFLADSKTEAANERVLRISKYQEDTEKELKDARSVIEALESQNILSLNELEELRESNSKLAEILRKKEQKNSMLRKQLGVHSNGDEKLQPAGETQKDKSLKNLESEDSPLQEKLKRMQASLEKTRNLNSRFLSDEASQTCLEQEKDEVRRQVEVETTEVIVCLQEELTTFQQQVEDSNRNELLAKGSLMRLETEMKDLNGELTSVTQENERLIVMLERKEKILSSLSEDWARLAYEIAEVLSDGNLALEDASDQVSTISEFFPDSNWVTEQVGKMIRSISERDLLIEELQKCLEDAENLKCDMEWKLGSLRGAALAITEAQQQENSEKYRHILQLTSELDGKISIISELENNQMLFQSDTEKQIEALEAQLGQCQEKNANLLKQIKESQEEHTQGLGKQLIAKEGVTYLGDDISKAKMELNEFKVGVNMLHSCMSECVEEVSCATEDYVGAADCSSKHRIGDHSNEDIISNKELHTQCVSNASIFKMAAKKGNDSERGLLSEDTLNREPAIFLLRRELESALDSLKGVQAQMVKLLDEKEEVKKSKLEGQKNIENMTSEVVRLRSEIILKEQQFQLQFLELESKLQAIEGDMMTSSACWHIVKEGLELEITDANAIAAEKTIEASILLTQFEEAQETMQDADKTINELIKANEIAKLEVERHKKAETMINLENICLSSEIQALQSCLDVKGQEYESMENNFHFNLMETSSLVLALEDTFKLIQNSFTEKFQLITEDLCWLKSQFHHQARLSRVFLEEIWLEIVGKDCAFSVLHLCHMEIMLERITGLSAENGFLYHGLCDSNSVVAELREHNLNAEKELEMCSILKGKLLVDINSSLNCITKKEVETTEFKARLNSFEDKIMQLQLQEESMLDKSCSMASELAILTNDLDARNRNVSIAVSAQEKFQRENQELRDQLEKKTSLLNEANIVSITLRDLLYEELELSLFDFRLDASMKFNDLMVNNMTLNKVLEFRKLIRCQIEAVGINIFVKDFKVLVLASELEQVTNKFNLMALQKLDLEKQVDTLGEVNEKLKIEFILNKLDVELKDRESYILLIENEKLKHEVLDVREDSFRATEDLKEAKIGLSSSLKHVRITDDENHRLEEIIHSNEVCIARLQTQTERTHAELEVNLKDLELKNEVNESQRKRTDTVEMENESLRNELVELKRFTEDYMVMIDFKLRHCCDLTCSLSLTIDRVLQIMDGGIISLTDKMYQEISECKDRTTKFVDELGFLEFSAKELASCNVTLQSELMRKVEVSKGLSFDLSLLQESASIAKDQKDKLAILLESVETEFSAKSCELDEAVAVRGQVEIELLAKNERIDGLELEIAEKNNALKLVAAENLELKADIEQILNTRSVIEKELTETINATERLEDELLVMSSSIDQRNHCLEDLQSDITKLAAERDQLIFQVHVLQEHMEMAHTVAEEQEAIATEARQIAEERKTYAADLEEENKLLERSVEELEYTVNVLENKVEFIKEEAERLQLQREESEIELKAVRHQISEVPASSSNCKIRGRGNLDIARCLKEKMNELQEAHESILVLQKEVADKDAEIVQCKEHMSELNMHAEAQAREYKLKFKELEAMAHQVKVDTTSSNASSLTTMKSEKGVPKSRGSGSPFKCIGLGLSQQMSSEKDEELTAARRRIEELEALAASRQKEIFMLNTRLAAAESMTHDVIRDLLGLKMDMTNCASLIDLHQGKNAIENSPCESHQYHKKDQEVAKLKRQLNRFVEERESWLVQINQRHTEMVAAQIALEKFRHREQFLLTENEMLKVDNSKYKKFIVELEDEVKELSEQQNLQQRIHHHAKIKEENNLLRIQNDDLNKKLQRSDSALLRVKEELARYRSACGKKPYIDVDEEELLMRKLNESEDERIQLAEKLLSLCTNILKVAGLSPPSSTVNPSTAEDALNQLKDHIDSLEYEVQDLKMKCKLFCEKIRLAEVKQHLSSPLQENCQSPVTLDCHAYHHHEAVERG